jgi:hypothetical protein
MKLLELCGAKFDIVLKEKKCHVSYDHGVLVSLLSALIMNKNMEAKTSGLLIDKKLIRYE